MGQKDFEKYERIFIFFWASRDLHWGIPRTSYLDNLNYLGATIESFWRDTVDNNCYFFTVCVLYSTAMEFLYDSLPWQRDFGPGLKIRFCLWSALQKYKIRYCLVEIADTDCVIEKNFDSYYGTLIRWNSWYFLAVCTYYSQLLSITLQWISLAIW